MNPYLKLFMVMPLLVVGQSKNFLDKPYLETSAKVDTLVAPDKVYLNITLREADSKGKKSIEELENAMAEQLRRLGIDLVKQLKIKDMDSDFKTYFLRSKDVLKSKQFSLVVYDGLTVGKVFAALENTGIANTYIDRTEYSKMETLELELKSRAIKKAKQKAGALTRPLNQNVGKALHIVDNAQAHYQTYGRAKRQLNAMAEMPQPEPLDADFEKIRVAATVTVIFELLD